MLRLKLNDVAVSRTSEAGLSHHQKSVKRKTKMAISMISGAPMGISRNPDSAGLSPTLNEESLKTQNEAEVARQFESLLVSMMLKQMRQSSSEEGMFPGDKSDTYGGMFDMFMGDHIAATGTFGIKELLASQNTIVPSSLDSRVDEGWRRASANAVYQKGVQEL
jgi:hypothetical protein